MKKFIITVNGKAYDVEVSEVVSGGNLVTRPTRPAAPTIPTAPVAPVAPKAEVVPPTPAQAPAAPVVKKEAGPVAAGATPISAPMPGKILSVAVNVGDQVAAGDVLCILEAMKMQNEISADVAGTVSEIRVETNQNVAASEVLVVIS